MKHTKPCPTPPNANSMTGLVMTALAVLAAEQAVSVDLAVTAEILTHLSVVTTWILRLLSLLKKRQRAVKKLFPTRMLLPAMTVTAQVLSQALRLKPVQPAAVWVVLQSISVRLLA